MRHAIQKAGHECLPLLFMLVACGTGVLFYLGNFWPGSPPGWVVVPVLVTLALCTEWLTFTFNQDMQDAFTSRRGRGFPVVRALLASAVSTFIFATASSGLWAPRGASDKALWAWILAVGVFGSQLLLKLVPEKTRAPHSLQNIAAAIEEWTPGATVEEQAHIARRVYQAVSEDDRKALPALSTPLVAQGQALPDSEVTKNGSRSFPARETDTSTHERPSTRSYARLSQPEMLQRLREFQAGSYQPRTRYEKRDLNRRLRAYIEAGVEV